jgi:hypothetical protein
LSLLARVSRLLAARGIDHAVIGAAALAAHGVARATADVVLLKLYAGGPQDAWDIDQLLDVDPSLVAGVEARLAPLPADCAELWDRIRRQR